MSQHVEQLPPESPPTRNRGWFQPGDRRINREGRPRGSKARRPETSAPPDCAAVADRLKVLVLPVRDLAFRLGQQHAPWIVNLPDDVEIVSCRVDADRNRVALILRSQAFPRV